MTETKKPLPELVSQDEWLAAHEKFLEKEKSHTRARAALNAERRRQPMYRIDKDYAFDGPGGKTSLPDLFDGRRQLILYHFMFGPNAIVPYGRQEDWEDSPEGWPKGPRYEWWRHHDKYDYRPPNT